MSIKYDFPWGKFAEGERHHLAHHCADVSACFEAIISLPVFPHDIGKLHPGFQAKAWPAGHWSNTSLSHIAAGLAIFCSHRTQGSPAHAGIVRDRACELVSLESGLEKSTKIMQKARKKVGSAMKG